MNSLTEAAWLALLCDPERYGIEKPFGVTWRGRRWLCATEGHLLVLLDRPDAPEIKGAPNVGAVLGDPTTTGAPIDGAAFRAWVGAPVWPQRIPCPECKGTRKPTCDACDGEKQHCCDKCDAMHECGKCHGSGVVHGCGCCDRDGKVEEILDADRVKLFGYAYNRHLLGRALYGVSDATSILMAKEMVRIEGPGWVVAVMRLLEDPSKPVASEWPAP